MKDSLTARGIIYNGTHGNLSAATLKDILNAEPVDTEINLGVLPAGAEVVEVVIIHDNLGAGTSIKLGYQYVDPENGSPSDTYFGTHTTTAAGRKESTAKPIRFEDPIHLVAKVTGAPATGELYVIPKIINHGTK